MADFFQSQPVLSGLFGQGSGFNGLFNQSVGGASQGLNRSPLNLLTNSNPNSLGIGAQPNSQGNSLLERIGRPERDSRPGKERENDRLDLSEFADQAAEKAVEEARRGPQVGDTNQIFVSEDGLFEASVDLRFNSDGSYELDLAVRFAESAAAGFESLAAPAQLSDENANPEDFGDPSLEFASGANVLAERYTSFEQVLEARGFQAEIFFEQSKSIAAGFSSGFDSELGQEFTSVAQQVSEEYTLNVSIRGDDLNNFNAVAEQLAGFDDTGTLSGFLEAARNVVTSGSQNFGGLVEASQSLLSATQQHVGAKLNNFFTSIQEDFGGSLEEAGFEPSFFERLGENVNNDLNRFFEITNNFFNNQNGDTGNVLDSTEDPDQQVLDTLEKNLEQLREQREEAQNERRTEETSSPRALVNFGTPQPSDETVDVTA